MKNFSMRRVVGGRIYDTETAKFIATVAQRSQGNFDDEFTQLFQTKKGAFFLAGTGGGCSRWREKAPDGNGWVDGEGLTPISAEIARPLVELHAPEMAEDLFECEEA